MNDPHGSAFQSTDFALITQIEANFIVRYELRSTVEIGDKCNCRIHILVYCPWREFVKH